MLRIPSILSIFFLTSLLSFDNFQYLKAQGCCSGGTPLSGNLELTTSAAKTLSVRLIYDYNHLGDLVSKSKELNDKTRTRLTHSGLLRLGYAFDNRWALTALLPIIRQVEKIDIGVAQNSTVGQGFGDIVLMLQYNIFNDNTYSWSVAAGAKTATGPTNRSHELTGLLLNPDLQPGTGSWDILAVSQFNKRDFLLEQMFFRAGITYRYTTTADRFNQQQRYKFGNELQVNWGLTHQLFWGATQITPQLMFRYRYTEVDQSDGSPAPNTGGHWGYVLPGVEVLLDPRYGFGLVTQWPLYRRLTGVQLTTSYKITVSVFYNFSFANSE